MKKMLSLVLMLIVSTVCFSQIQKKIKLNKDYWNTFEMSTNLISIDTTGISDVVSIFMPDSLSEKTYSFASKSIPLNVVGDTVEVKCSVKYDDVKTKFEPFSIVINSYYTPIIESDTNSQDTILVKKNDWTEVSYKYKIPYDSKNLFIQIYNPYYHGRVSVSNVQIFIDNKPYQLATELKYAKDRDREFDINSKINLSSVTEAQIKNLELLGKYWGYLKYYHPQAGSFDYNFDYELFRMMPKVLAAKNQKQVEKLFLDYLISLGEYERAEIEPATDVILHADYGWMRSLKNVKLVSELEKLKSAKRGFNSYITIDDGYPMFVENSYDKVDSLDAGYRILALFRYWNAINYFYPYKNILSSNWNDVLRQSIQEFVDADTQLKYELAVMKLAASINDTHAYKIYDQANAYFGENLNAAIIKFVEGKPLVIGSVGNDTTNVLQRGDFILEVDGKSIEELKDFYKPYFAASNDRVFHRDLAYNLLRSKDSTLQVTFERDGKTRTSTVVCDKSKRDVYASTVFLEKEDNLYVKDSVLYVYIRSVDVGALQQKLLDTTAYKGLIIDLRCYPKNSPFPLLGYLFEKDVPFVKFSGASIATPGESRIIQIDKAGSGAENPDYFKGKAVVLVDEGTQSFAEWMAMWFQAAPNVVTIGSQTAGADGNVTILPLTGGLNAMFSGVGVFYPDGTGTQRVGLRLDELVKPTIEGMRAGRDEVLERAFEVVNAD